LRGGGFELLFSTPEVQPGEGELLRLVPDCDGYLAGVEKISARVLDAAKKLRVIARNGVGLDNVDLAKARERGIKVCPATGANARGVAELTIGLMFALYRSIPWSDHQLKAGQWQRRSGMEIRDRTFGVVGCGAIGKEVCLMATGLGMNVLTHDPYADHEFRIDEHFDYTDLDDLYRKSDVISLHCPSSPGSPPLIDHESISKMKRGVYLMNTARAELIDEEAVLNGLEAGVIGGVALDVYRQEPPVQNQLVKHERVIATPHIGALTEESVSRAVSVAVDHLLKELA